MSKKQKKKKIDKGGAAVAAKKKKSVSKPSANNEWKPSVVFPEFKTSMDETYQKVFKISAGVMLLIMVVCSQFVGIPGDDKMQNEYEQKLIDYYSSFGEDKGALNLEKTKMHLYGGLFEVVSGAANRMLGNSSPNDPGYHKVRHFFNALFGFAAMLFVALIALEIAGWQAALLALFFIFLSPRFFGHSLMNPKDIPFATGYLMTLYFTIRLLKQLPKPSWQTLIGLALGIGIAIGVRVGGLLSVAIMGLFVGIHFLMNYGLKNLFSPITGKYALYTIGPTLAGLVFAILFWPYALQNPIVHIQESLAEMSKYGLDLKLLFNGDMIYSKKLPIDYVPRWVFVTIPMFTILGLAITVIFANGIFKKYSGLLLSLVIFAFLFPFIYVMAKDSVLYDGWRHLIFPYGAGVALFAVAWNYLIEEFKENRKVWYAVLGVCAITMLDPAVFMARNPALSHTYFSPMIGGISGAEGKYELDYWGTSVKQGLEWMEKEGIISPDMQDTVLIGTNFYYALSKLSFERYGGKVRPVYVRYRERYKNSWDYGLFVNRFMDGAYLRAGSFPNSYSIGTINANGTPILSIDKINDKAVFEADQAIRGRRWEEGLQLFRKVVVDHPDNEIAWAGMANAYLNLRQLEQAKNAANKVFEIDPENLNGMNFFAMAHFMGGDVTTAQTLFQKAVDVHPKNSMAMYYLGTIAFQKKQHQVALSHCKKCIEVYGRFKPCYQLAASVYDELGDSQNAQAYRNALAKIK